MAFTPQDSVLAPAKSFFFMSDHPILNITDVATPDAYPAITAATLSGEWPALTERLERTAADYRRAPSLHTLVQLEGTLHAILRAPRDTLGTWADAEPGNPWPWLAQGMADTYAGLDARGTETADQLTEAEWEQVAEYLTQAQAPLTRALELGVQPGPALAAIGQAATVMGVPEEDHQQLLAQLAEADPNWLPAWSSALARSEARWGGSLAHMGEVVALAERAMTVPELHQLLTAEHWWWRANRSATIDGDLVTARGHLRAGLEDCPPGRTRAALLVLEAQILASMDAPAREIAEGWQAAVDAAPDDPTHQFDLGLAWVDAGDIERATAVLTRLAERPGPEGLEAANWLGRCLARGRRGFPQDRAAAERWFRRTAEQGPDGKLNLAELQLEDDPHSEQALALCRAAIAEGNAYGALPLARAYLARGEQAEAKAVLNDAPVEFTACKYALARGLDEGWFGTPDTRAALEVSNTVLPQVFDPYLSVLHMTLLSAQGNWDAARQHGRWLLEETAEGRLDLPDPLFHEVERLLGAIPKPGLGGLLKRTFSKDRLRMEVESPDLWAI